MKILVVSENFLLGGLERQILTQKSALPDVEFVYAFCNYQEHPAFAQSRVYRLAGGYSVRAFLDNVETLKGIIETERIDAVHAHPFFSLFPALFAAYLTLTPICYTVHGYASVNFPHRINTSVLFSYFMNCLNAPVFCVSRRYQAQIEQSFGRKNVFFLPNCLETERYGDCAFQSGKWVLVSRLDEDKKKEILLLIDQMETLGIRGLDLIGAGSSEKELKAAAQGKNVRFLGYSNTVPEDLKRGYMGVIGVGQTVLEGLASNLPVLLIGDGRVTGLVDRARYEKIKEYNFVNRFLADDPPETIAAQIAALPENADPYRLRELIAAEFDAKSVYQGYLAQVQSADVQPNRYFGQIYEKLKAANENGALLDEEDFYDSEAVYYILQSYFKHYCLNRNVLEIFHRCDLQLKNRRLGEALDRAEGRIGELTQTLSQVRARLAEQEEQRDRLEREFQYFRDQAPFRLYRALRHPFRKKRD